MVEVFKTNVKNCDHATMLIEEIHKIFVGYKANFDLEDCDRILRIKYTTDIFQFSKVINLLKSFGYEAEVLEVNEPIFIN